MLIITPSLSITEWSSATFSLLTLTTGSNNLTNSFSWSYNNVPIANATTSVYQVNPALASNAGTYTLAYTGSINGTGIIGYSSSVATLTINPLVVSSPTSLVGMEGSAPGALVAVFSSSIPMTFSWTLNGASVNNGVQFDSTTGSSYSVNPGQYIPQTQGQYTVTATTDSGSASTSATLNFMPLGMVIGGPQWNPYEGGWIQPK